MLNLTAQLGDATARRFMEGLVRARYHLLLGAGASVGGKSRDGRSLPGGQDLADELKTKFGLTSSSRTSLKRVYMAVKGQSSGDGLDLADYINERFTSTSPPEWMARMVSVPWAQLWTLNIDDCVERAYFQHSPQAFQKVVSISWTDRHRTAKLVESQVLLVHLHGKASRAGRENELVFDISSYVNSATDQHRWHKVFGDDYPAEPFLIVGASLDGEIDLQGILEQGHMKLASEHPSIIVLPHIDPMAAAEYRSYGLIPVEAYADDFFESIHALVPEYLDAISDLESLSLADTAPEAINFLHQWRHLRTKEPVSRRDRRHDLYSGHEPEWVDVLEKYPFNRDVERKLVKDLTEHRDPGSSSLSLLVGDAFTGKSTVLLNVAAELANQGFAPFLFDGDVAPDHDAIIWWLRRHPKTVLLIDDAEDFAKDIAEILRATSSDPVTLRIIAAERTHRLRHVENQLATLAVSKTTIHGRLTPREIDKLIARLSEKKRLGDLTTLTSEERRSFFDARGRELFSSMADIERGRGFDLRVMDEYAALPAGSAVRLVNAAAVTSKLGYGLPLDIVKGSTRLIPREVDALLRDSSVADLITVKRGSLHLRHRFFGSLVYDKCMSVEDRVAVSRAIALALAPHVSPAAIASSTREYRIARALMSSSFLAAMTHDREQVLAWYESVEDAYDWNARFWEQRALAAAELGLFERAFSWAKEAVRRREDSYTLNTVGAVLMRRAVSEASPSEWPADSFEAAERALAEARDLEGSQAEYPFETFFNYTIRLINKVKSRDEALNEQLRQLWVNWRIRVLTLNPVVQEKLRVTLDRTSAQWAEAGMD